MDAECLSREDMTRLLFHQIKDDGRQGDCIFVFGSQRSLAYRVPKAIELYKQGRAGKILFSGGNQWEGQEDVEALVMKQGAINEGIPETDIITEIRSTSTRENVLSSLLELDRAMGLHRLKRILIVTTAFHMRRCYLNMRTYMPEWIEYSLCPVDDRKTREDNWFLHETGIQRVTDECRNLIHCVQSGKLQDEEMD
ncbi:hypothetical protein PL1_3077 [Paenibacillus larvae subsp. larvae B-3650]|nr:hypothetical protein PL1_3077 [Paenibacillus larvae subsp. larvae B-3650]